MPKKQISICKNCKFCIVYKDPTEETTEEKFSVVGYTKGIELYKTRGAFCGVAGILIPFNVLQCEEFEEKEK